MQIIHVGDLCTHPDGVVPVTNLKEAGPADVQTLVVEAPAVQRCDLLGALAAQIFLNYKNIELVCCSII